MKNTGKCPKCGAEDLIRIPGGVGNQYSANLIYGGFLSFSIPVERFVCGQCGFSEEWVIHKDNLERLRKKFGATTPDVRPIEWFLDPSPKEE